MSPLHVLQQGPYGARSFISRDNSLFIHLYLSESPIKEPSHEKRGKYLVTAHGAPRGQKAYYNGLRPGSPTGSFTTLQSLPQCHAAFSRIPSTLAWVDQIPISHHVS
jgi:hypothetical protein